MPPKQVTCSRSGLARSEFPTTTLQNQVKWSCYANKCPSTIRYSWNLESACRSYPVSLGACRSSGIGANIVVDGKVRTLHWWGEAVGARRLQKEITIMFFFRRKSVNASCFAL